MKEDIRITKTKRDLRQALYQLITKQRFEKITVGQICATAMVNRLTFYKHYADKYELLNDTVLEIRDSIVARAVDSRTPNVTTMNATDFILHLADIVIDECEQRKKFLQAINNNDMVAAMIGNTIAESVTQLLMQLGQKHPFRYPVDMLAVAITGAATYLIKYWLFQETGITKEVFLSQTNKFITDLFASGLLMQNWPRFTFLFHYLIVGR